ncbi:unnamed protein product [Hymenolepis diminuta]|uniref:SH2 domain-containing protein n=1 Tax=Hymenolepis diminuta TaxID=6216 RepID=A0A0R3SDG2_HYMDI|nr:unnamed protein product [Hymenolepis diminuta]VUZ45480.1 unnamed protein product [Hymenolepis diminuta]
MIFRVRDPPNTSTHRPTSLKPSESRSSPSPTSLESDNESVGGVKIDPVQVPSRRRQETLQTRLSYIESGEDPFEEIVIRAETYFPSLTNIVRDPASSYIVEQTSYETQPPIQPSLPPSIPRPTIQPRRQLTRSASATRPNPFNTSAAETKRRTEEELDRRIMMYSRSHRNSFSFYSQPSCQGGNLCQQGPPAMQYGGGYYPQQQQQQQQQVSNFQPQQQQQQDVSERTTYDYRDFQAARQIFEQRPTIGKPQPAPPPMPRNHLHRLELRPQNSIGSTSELTESVFNGGGCAARPICPLNGAPQPVPRFQHVFNPPPPPPPINNQEGSTAAVAIVKREPRNPFSGGCGCGPGAGCGALPDTPIHRDQSNPREAIKKFLVSEEIGPGGVKSVFSFPGGMEPSDLTLLRAAVSANAPKDAFIPEENDDLEEQLNRQLEKTCMDPRSIQMVHEQALQQSSQPQQPPPPQNQPIYTVSRAMSACMNNGNITHMTVQHHQRPSISKSGPRQPQEGQGNVRNENPLETLMMNGITNTFVGPNSPGQIQGSATYPMCIHHHQQVDAGNNVANNWEFSGQGFGGNYQTFTTYNSSRFDGVPMGSGGGGRNQA